MTVARMPKQVSIFEVGPRDGLQNEGGNIALKDKVELIHQLADAGLKRIEAGSFVSAKWVPQMADSGAVLQTIARNPGTVYAALTPNMRGFEDAVAAGADEVAVFAAASESFSQRNINCSIAESLERFKPIFSRAAGEGIRVRGYVSCVIACPYDGPTRAEQVSEVTRALHEMGCYEVSLGDTIGVGTPAQFKRLLDVLLKSMPVEKLALHCHDTYGQALANIYAGLEYGISTVDSSIAGLGGCPYAKGASGNVATEDVVYLLHGLGIETGVNLEAAIKAGWFICDRLAKTNGSKVASALKP